jgi:hypothetical protein
VEMTRAAGEAFDDAAPGEGAFADFNTTLSGIPLSNQVLADAVLDADEGSFFVSHYQSTDTSNRATILESHRSGDYFGFATADLGTALYAQGNQRRIPTGVSSDLLTLFYFDEVEDELRAAWRINLQQPFKAPEALALGTGARAAAPNRACTRLYFSAQGDDDLDLFSIDVTPP